MSGMERMPTEKTGRLFVVSGPSGSGKSTLCRAAAARAGVHLSVSATTRPPGDAEVDGKDYYFLGKDDFLEKVEAGRFLEYARVFDYYYGTPAQPVLKKLEEGRSVLLEIDIQGGGQVFENYPKAVGILILPPSFEELAQRLRERGRDDEETIQKRLAKAQAEVDEAQRNQRYQHTVVNEDLEETIEELMKLIGSDKSH
jgi:guanylate kinase